MTFFLSSCGLEIAGKIIQKIIESNDFFFLIFCRANLTLHNTEPYNIFS